MFRSNKAEFLRRFITIDETWVHHFTPETKEQSKQWTEKGESAPKKAKTWPENNGEYYANLLQRLGNEIKEKRPHLAKKKVLFHQDNASSHIHYRDGQNQ